MNCGIEISEMKCCCGFKQSRCFYKQIGECPIDYPNKYLNKNNSLKQ